MTFIIRTLIAADWPAIKEIYQQGIDTGDATYETQAPAAEALKGGTFCFWNAAAW